MVAEREREREREMSSFVYIVLSLVLLYLLEKLVLLQWWRPIRVQRNLRGQGVGGPSYWPVIGSLGELGKIYAKAGSDPSSPPPSKDQPHHKVVQLVFPHLQIWREKYGNVMLYWYGRSPRLSITDPELIKELANNPRKYDQSIQHPLVYQLLGKSIITMGRENWAAQRRLLNPLFVVDSLKGLPGILMNAMEERIESWSKLMEPNGLEIDTHKEFESLAQYVIARVIFGNDVEEGLPITQLQSKQAAISSQTVKIFYVPGSRFLPTPLNLRSKQLRSEVEKRFNALIDKRLGRKKQQDDQDWLALMLSSNTMSRQQIIDDCCTILIAGSESTNLLLCWSCVLLGIYTDWQDRAREEIQQVLKGRRPTAETLSHLKILNMIINETLRLYPPIPFVMRRSDEEQKLGSLIIPSGTDIEVPIIAVHHDKQQWGENADLFDPGRFSEGISKASKHPMAFMPFMQGPRICLGMNFAMTEARILLAMVLHNFVLTSSPRYKHEPVCGITLKPGNGALVMFHAIPRC